MRGARALGVGVLLLGVLSSALASRRLGVDYASLHLMADGIANGTHIYDPAVQKELFATRYEIGAPPGMFYPPATGFAMLPFAFLPYRLGMLVWLALLVVAVVFGVRILLSLVAPKFASLWPLVAGLALLSASVRWGMTALQGAPLLLGLLCVLISALHTNRPRLALAVAVFATAFKITLAVPFLGLLLLRRRYTAVAAAVGGWVALNVAGFARIGGLAAYRTYQANMRVVEALGNINTPDPFEFKSIPRVDWTYLFHGLGHNLLVARVLSLLLAGVTALWLLREGRRARDPGALSVTTVFVTPLVCLGSLAVYHHHYDLSLLLVPLLLTLFGAARVRRPLRALWAMAPLLFLILLAPVGKAQSIMLQRFGMTGLGWVRLMFPLAVSLTLMGSLTVLRRRLDEAAAEDDVMLMSAMVRP